MKYRRIGQSGLKISEIAIGGWLTYGGTVAKTKSEPIIKTALEKGINFIDLADVYSTGKAESVIGEIIADVTRSDLVLSSKVFWPMSDNINDHGLSRKHIFESVEKSLKRLKTDYLDIYYCHRFDDDVPLEETIRAMDDLIHQGKILYWGTSVWQSDRIQETLGICEKYNFYKPIVEQPRFNMIDRHIELNIMETCHRNGIGLTVWSPLHQGILSGKYNDGIPKGSRADISNWLKHDLNDVTLKIAQNMAKYAADMNLSLPELALAWILKHKEISCAIIGATSKEQLESNIKASDVVLTENVIEEIENILDNKPVKPPM